jgi:hypothetical protein
MAGSAFHPLPQPCAQRPMSEEEKFDYWIGYAARAKKDNETYSAQQKAADKAKKGKQATRHEKKKKKTGFSWSRMVRK